jgi:hypothetical protein
LRINLASPQFAYPVLASKALNAKVVIAIAADALVSGFDTVPVIEASRDWAVNLDTVPSEIVTAGGVVATTTVKSSFQTDSVGLKMRLAASWALRAPNAIAFMQNVTW